MLLTTRAPIGMWAHTSRASPGAEVLRWLWRRAGDRVRWLAVSEVARATLSSTLGVSIHDIDTVDNPIEPADVVGAREPSPTIRVAYLGLAAPHKGFDLRADIVM